MVLTVGDIAEVVHYDTTGAETSGTPVRIVAIADKPVNGQRVYACKHLDSNALVNYPASMLREDPERRHLSATPMRQYM